MYETLTVDGGNGGGGSCGHGARIHSSRDMSAKAAVEDVPILRPPLTLFFLVLLFHAW